MNLISTVLYDIFMYLWNIISYTKYNIINLIQPNKPVRSFNIYCFQRDKLPLFGTREEREEGIGGSDVCVAGKSVESITIKTVKNQMKLKGREIFNLSSSSSWNNAFFAHVNHSILVRRQDESNLRFVELSRFSAASQVARALITKPLLCYIQVILTNWYAFKL